MANEGSQLDILINLALTGDAEAKRKIQEIKEELAKPGPAMTNTGAGLASNPAEFSDAQKQRVELTLAEAEATDKVATKLKQLIGIKKALGEEYSDETAKLLQLNRAIEASPLAAHREKLDAKKKAEAAAKDESARHKTVLDELKEAQQEEGKSTDAATEKKKSLLGGLKGLSTEFPRLAQLVRAGSSVWGALAVGITAAIAATRQYLADIEKLEDASRAFDTVGSSVATVKERTRELATHNAQLARDYELISTHANTAAAGLQRVNDMLEMQQLLERKLVDAELKRDLAKIKNSEMGPLKKAQEEANAVERAEARVKQIEADGEKKKVANLQAAAAAAASTERTARAQKAEVDSGIPDAQNRADTDRVRAITIADREKTVAALLEQQRKYAARIAGDKEGVTDFWNYSNTASDLKKEGIDSPNLAGTTGNKRRRLAEQLVQDIDAQTGKKSIAAETADMVAANTAAKLVELQKEQARLDGIIRTAKTEQAKWQQQITEAAAKAAAAAPLKAKIEAAETGSKATDQQGRNRAAIEPLLKQLVEIFMGDIPEGSVGSEPRKPKAPPAPVAISDAERRAQAKLASEAALRPADSKAVELREVMEREQAERAAEQQKLREKWGIEDGLDKLRRNPKPVPEDRRGNASVDTQPVIDSTRELTGGISAFAEQSVSLHGTTARTLEKLTTALADLETRFNNGRIA